MNRGGNAAPFLFAFRESAGNTRLYYLYVLFAQKVRARRKEIKFVVVQAVNLRAAQPKILSYKYLRMEQGVGLYGLRKGYNLIGVKFTFSPISSCRATASDRISPGLSSKMGFSLSMSG